MNNVVKVVAARSIGVLTAVLTLLATLLVAAGAAQVATSLPGGKANWVVSIGHLEAAKESGYRNWVRLGYYAFRNDGTVTTNYWSWNQRDQPKRVDAMTVNCGGDVPTCPLRTVDGFADGPMGGYRGFFGYTSDGRLVVTWSDDAAGTALEYPITEFWHVTTGLADGRAARLTSPTHYGDFGDDVAVPARGAFATHANFGVGYGSNASLGRESRAGMRQLIEDSRYNAEPYRGSYVVSKSSWAGPARRTGIVGREGAGGAWTFGAGPNPWKLCAGSPCMGWLQPRSSCASTDKDRVRYIGEIGGGRRSTEEYWCRSLAQGSPCYAHNSHPRPMLQVIDDSGEFQGWVGVEAFTHVSTRTGLPDDSPAEGYWGVFDMVATSLQPELRFRAAS